eukprot:TRINITY_DN14425_c0_g1_i1.p1 TRINITY_DN14425_c0_g1~~TRINITY_DN14425_c0_g1_i1.p1  ORF type:complete len:818 (-),score=285.09 TRINITY_DN14425_c0_g1_i1:169-2622(-)
MSSRILSSPKHVFDCFLEVVGPQGEGSQPWILQSFPPSYKDKETDKLKSVPQFTFPCPTPITEVQHFSFVLTNLEAQWTFGFCRYSPHCETALCILSSLPWHELFAKMLDQCAELLQAKQGQLSSFLSSVHSASLPLPGLVFHVQWGQNIFTSSTPSSFHLPSIPDNRNLTEYYNAVDSNTMLIIFASMLYERRILITSRKLSRLSACVQAANALIYPMFWQHIFIPVLPAHLMDYLSAPMPFLIGVPEPLIKRIKRAEVGDVVILDADNNKVETPFNDLDSLPTEVLSNLRKALKPGTGLLGDSVARAFLQALVHLIGGYRDALRYRQGEKITFSEDAFIMSRSTSLQPFLEQMLQLQLFRQFIDERLDMLNSGKGFSDEFELECVVFTEKTNKKFKYSAITNNVKREGAALANALKGKANPAMKQAVRSVKDGGKMAKIKAKASYKDVRSKFKENKDELKDDSSSTQSAPSSPTTSRSSTLPYSTPIPLTRNNTDLNFGQRVLKYERFDPPDERRQLSPELEDLPRLEYNLMSELDEIMMRNKSGSMGSSEKRAGHSDLSTMSTPIRKSSIVNHERKSSVDDLISLGSEQEHPVVFDPLLDIQRQQQNPHRRLSRTSNPSTGKYENYVPPGGSSQPQFRQFLATMTDQGRQDTSQQVKKTSNPLVRSSDDLLTEYGLNFNSVSISSSNTRQAPNYSTVNQPFHHNGNLSAPTIPPRNINTSFLHNSGTSFQSQSTISTLPVNSSLSVLSSRQGAPQPLPSCRDILADLDPLRSDQKADGQQGLSGSGYGAVVGGPHHLQPPSVPPRTKKQWTTFD